MTHRAIRRELDKLQQQLETKRIAFAAREIASFEMWIRGAGLALACGFINRLAAEELPPRIDRAFLTPVLADAAAEGLLSAGSYMKRYRVPACACAGGGHESSCGMA